MKEGMYQMIWKRKSFHIFRNIQHISPMELEDIKKKYQTLKPLVKDIKTDIKIVPGENTNCKRGEEYCIFLYSEKKGNYLQNIGYIGEQLDLYLALLNIGSLWFGIGKTEEIKYNDLDFVMMIAIAKVDASQFRKDMYKSKRKALDEIWFLNEYKDIGNIVRFAPSACNTQPWIVEGNTKEIQVYRYKKPGKRGIMPIKKVTYTNRIDIGIFLLFLELCFQHENINYKRTLYNDFCDDEKEKTLLAIYHL